MRGQKLFNCVVLLALLAACDSPSAGARSRIEGTWAYTLTSYKYYTAGGIPCTASGITLVLEHLESRPYANVGGTVTGGTFSCIREGKTTSEPVPAGLASGMIRGDSVSLDFTLSPHPAHIMFMSRGVIRGDQITGVATEFRFMLMDGDTVEGGVGKFTATKVRR